MDDKAFKLVASDAGLRAVLLAARAWGVSPRRFLGWEPSRHYAHTYRDGRLVGTVETLETEWDDESRDLAMALAMWESDLCPQCRQPMSETTARENEGRYVPHPAIRCHYCTASRAAGEQYHDSPQSEALFIPVTFQPPPEE